MKLKKTIVEQTIRNAYEIIIWYEHGDGDANTQETMLLKDKSEEDIILYIEAFNEVQQIINSHREDGVDIPPGTFKDGRYIVKDKMYIETEYDLYSQDSKHFAAMGIEKIYYYDDVGQKFLVEVQ